ncbi:WLM domain-containing protein [Schizosaccharomyces pombe]
MLKRSNSMIAILYLYYILTTSILLSVSFMLRINDDDHPNEKIGFISAIKGDFHDLSSDYLKRIAAMAFPIMKEHGFGVTSLDEVAYNAKFWGRNWNKGECIELVLRDASNRWLPFEFVMDVFLHELCHIWQGPHDRRFFSHLSTLRAALIALYAKGYKGPGKYMTWDSFVLANVVGNYNTVVFNGITLERSTMHGVETCGGSLQRKKKIRRKPTPSSTKKRKLTRTGQKLGTDMNIRLELLKSPAKPQAQSMRGREARIAAALLRVDNSNESKPKDHNSSTTLENYFVVE